jgi:hypothetical protein
MNGFYLFEYGDSNPQSRHCIGWGKGRIRGQETAGVFLSSLSLEGEGWSEGETGNGAMFPQAVRPPNFPPEGKGTAESPW